MEPQATPAPPKPSLLLDRDRIWILFHYDVALVAAVRLLPGAR